MPVLSNLRVISLGALAVIFSACQPAESSKETVFSPSLAEQLGEIEVKTVPFDQLPGETRAEKLLYQAGIVSQMQTASLVAYDMQVEAVKAAGNSALAKELQNNRTLLMDAMNAEVETFVKDAGALYESHFTDAEIERMIAIHSDPVMQKLVKTQPQLSQDILPAAEAFGLRAGKRFEKAIADKASGK